MGNGRLGIGSKVWDWSKASLEVALYRGVHMGWPRSIPYGPSGVQRSSKVPEGTSTISRLYEPILFKLCMQVRVAEKAKKSQICRDQHFSHDCT